MIMALSGEFSQALFLNRRALGIVCLLLLTSFASGAAAQVRLPAGRGILELAGTLPSASAMTSAKRSCKTSWSR